MISKGKERNTSIRKLTFLFSNYFLFLLQPKSITVNFISLLKFQKKSNNFVIIVKNHSQTNEKEKNIKKFLNYTTPPKLLKTNTDIKQKTEMKKVKLISNDIHKV